MTSSPRASVVMPVYGAERWVGAAVESVLAQDMTDFELIIVDDEGPRESIAICESYDDERIRIIAQKNRGLPGARNTGIRNAVAPIIGFIDADDIWRPDKLRRQFDLLEARPDVGITYSGSRMIDEEGEPLGPTMEPKLDDVTVRDVFCRNPIGNGSTAILRRAVLDEIGYDSDRNGETETHYFDESFRFAEDVECWTRIAATTNWGFAGVGDLLTDYRLTTGSLSSSTDSHYEHWLRHYAKVAEYAPELAEAHGEAARGYQQRFYARRELRDGRPREAARWFASSMKVYPKMLTEEPSRTLVTGAAVAAGNVLPASVMEKVLDKAMRGGGASSATTPTDTTMENAA